MGSRSRKRGRAPEAPVAKPAPAARPTPPAAPREHTPGPLDEFSAVAPPAATITEEPAAEATPQAGTPAAGAPAGKPKRLRGAAADDAVRATLKPLEPSERPPALLIAVGIAMFFGSANLISLILGFKVDGKTPPISGVLAFAALMYTAAWGMWTKRYWALLGFQTLLGIIVIFFALFLPVASNLQAVALCVAVAGLGGWLFWKLVRVLSRVQMPRRPQA